MHRREPDLDTKTVFNNVAISKRRLSGTSPRVGLGPATQQRQLSHLNFKRLETYTFMFIEVHYEWHEQQSKSLLRP